MPTELVRSPRDRPSSGVCSGPRAAPITDDIAAAINPEDTLAQADQTLNCYPDGLQSRELAPIASEWPCVLSWMCIRWCTSPRRSRTRDFFSVWIRSVEISMF